MRMYPAIHYTMGGLWVDYELMSNVPGLFVIGEANFSDHGANRLGASALMQGLADGYFVLPQTIGGYFAASKNGNASVDAPEFRQAIEDVENRINKLLSIKGKKTVSEFHRELGKMMWDDVGMARTKDSLQQALKRIPELRNEFWENVNVLGGGLELNQALEQAGRVADFLEFGELLAYDALQREESCGGHFREEYQTEDGEALRNDSEYAFVSAWEHKGVDQFPVLHKEPLVYEEVKMAQRSYK
jgi:succinate dehydrogenase / fumarate reductase, flavoprotein subunit